MFVPLVGNLTMTPLRRNVLLQLPPLPMLKLIPLIPLPLLALLDSILKTTPVLLWMPPISTIVNMDTKLPLLEMFVLLVRVDSHML
jgi:hypothetical protein